MNRSSRNASICFRIQGTISRRLSFMVGVRLALRNFSVAGPELFDPLPNGLGNGHPHALCMAPACYYLIDETDCDVEFSCDGALTNTCS